MKKFEDVKIEVIYLSDGIEILTTSWEVILPGDGFEEPDDKPDEQLTSLGI